MGRSVVLLSGGIDSMACLAFLLKRGDNVTCLFVDYGQLAKEHEFLSATKIAELFNVKLQRIHVGLPDGIVGVGEIVGRNSFLAFLALSANPKSECFTMGIHSGSPYYDCSKIFSARMDVLFQEQTSGSARFFTPFIDWQKRDIISYCTSEALDLSITYSCEAGIFPSCGACASCIERSISNVS